MKKVVLTALIASLLVLPLSNTALADKEEAPEYRPAVTAEISPAEAMAPGIHGIVLAMMNHDVSSFDSSDEALTWECLYNMLSLYGQLDSRSQMEEEYLLFPVETAQDYAAALDVSLEDMPPMPAELSDRLTLADGVYRAVCGSDALSQLQVQDVQTEAGCLRLTGALVYLVEDIDLVQFQATLQPRGNMFGYAITALTLS